EPCGGRPLEKGCKAPRWRSSLRHVPFCGGWAGAIPPGYPAHKETYGNATRLVPTQLECGITRKREVHDPSPGSAGFPSASEQLSNMFDNCSNDTQTPETANHSRALGVEHFFK